MCVYGPSGRSGVVDGFPVGRLKPSARSTQAIPPSQIAHKQDVRSVMRLAVEEEASRVAAEQQQQGKAAASASGAKGVPVTGTVVKASKGPGTARCVCLACADRLD